MRAIDSTIKNRLLQAWQTQHNNSNPAMEVRVLRPRTPIFHRRFWQESDVAVDATAVCTSVAVRRTSDNADRVFLAYVTSAGNLVVKSAAIMTPVSNMIWTVEETITGCLACSLEFDGSFVPGLYGAVEYRTDDLPYLFYTTASGELKAGILGGSYETIVGENVTSFDAVRGVASKYKDIDQGLLLFYIINGYVYYRSLLGGQWQDQQTVSIAPANTVKVKAERVFDWRVVLQVQDNTGALHEVFSQPYYSGWVNVENLTAKATAMTVNVIEINFADYKATDEYITARPSGMEIAVKAAVVSPYIADAWNVPVSMYNEETEEWYDDYGYAVVVKWSDAVYGFEDNLDKIYIEDDYGMKWYAQEITRLDLHNRLLIRFTNMNNAGNPVTINYDGSGSLSSGVVSVTGCSKSFSLTNLVPYYVAPPVFVSAWNDGSQTIYVEFDKPIIDIASQSGFVISGFEPSMSPEGSLVQTTYGFDSVSIDAENETIIKIDLTYSGRMKYPQGAVTIEFTGAITGIGGGFVEPFTESFTPTGIVPFFMPNDAEYLAVQANITVQVTEVVYSSAQSGHEYLTAKATGMTIVVTKVGSLPL